MNEQQKLACLWMLAAAVCLIVCGVALLAAPSPFAPVVTRATDTTTLSETTEALIQSTSTEAEVAQTSFITSYVTVMIDLNTADKETLMLLNGLGETLAQRILDYRTRYGSFDSVEELLNVEGIGQTRLAQWQPYLTVS